MRSSPFFAAGALAAAVLVAGCHEASAPAAPATPANVSADAGPARGHAVIAPRAGGGGRGKRGGGGGGNGAGGGVGGPKRRFRTPFVYADGVPLGAMRFGELPARLETTWLPVDGLDKGVRRFVLIDYFAALGIDVKKIKTVHLYSGRSRVSVVDGDALRREKGAERTLFQFTQSNRGKVQMRWPDHTTTTDRIDKVNDVAVYLDKKPPEITHEGPVLDGKELDEIPYVTTDVQGGTHVTVDGTLRAFVRPRDLDASKGPVSLLEVISEKGISTAELKAADLIDGDELVRRLTVGQLPSLRVTAPGGGNGGVLQTSPDARNITAILLYLHATPPDWASR